jgi:hypothetical protein
MEANRTSLLLYVLRVVDVESPKSNRVPLSFFLDFLTVDNRRNGVWPVPHKVLLYDVKMKCFKLGGANLKMRLLTEARFSGCTAECLELYTGVGKWMLNLGAPSPLGLTGTGRGEHDVRDVSGVGAGGRWWSP